MAEFRGDFVGEGIKLGIIVTRFNEFVSQRLLDGALDYLKRHKVKSENIDIFWVPGSFEIPLVAKKLASSGEYDAIICLGAIIRGDTPHFTFLAAETTKGIAQVMLSYEIPIAFGILTTDTIEQAIERAGTKSGNKGWLAAESALEMVSVMEKTKGIKPKGKK